MEQGYAAVVERLRECGSVERDEAPPPWLAAMVQEAEDAAALESEAGEAAGWLPPDVLTHIMRARDALESVQLCVQGLEPDGDPSSCVGGGGGDAGEEGSAVVLFHLAQVLHAVRQDRRWVALALVLVGLCAIGAAVVALAFVRWRRQRRGEGGAAGARGVKED